MIPAEGIQILVSNSNIKRTKVNKNTKIGKSLSSSEIQILILPDENFHISRRTVLSNQIYINGLIERVALGLSEYSAQTQLLMN